MGSLMAGGRACSGSILICSFSGGSALYPGLLFEDRDIDVLCRMV
jgi:hypothetical protein